MITAVKGMKDLYFPESAKWERAERVARDVFRRYGYVEIRTPLLEATELFVRGIGGETDVVSKEMYTFEDRKGRSLTLRPENTAGVVRALLEHRLQDSLAHARVYYIGAQFRYERPQKGRYRQFHQMGVEAFGDASPGVDAEAIRMAVDYLEALGILDARVSVNSVGCPACRPVFVEVLRGFLSDREGALCMDCRKRLRANPLRVLDCKVPACQPTLGETPAIAEHLCDACREHHRELVTQLGLLEVAFEENARLVRGLDYYTRTVFEVVGLDLGAQNALVGGGRYDGLVGELGGPPLPAFGWALGVERILEVLPKLDGVRLPWVYLAWAGEGAHAHAAALARKLRAAGRAVVLEHQPRSFKSALKRADRLGVRHAVLLGEEEVASQRYTLKDLETGEQAALDAAGLLDRLPELVEGA